MRTEEYQEYLQKQHIPLDTIETQIAISEDFIKFLIEFGVKETTAGKAEVNEFAKKLIAEKSNSLENFCFLRDYCGWLGLRKLYVAWIEIMDCHNALEKLAGEIEKRYGGETHEQIFSDALPPLGADEKERCAYTRKITERITKQLTDEEAREAWFQVQHGIPTEFWLQSDTADKEKYWRCGGIDEFLTLKLKERDAQLTQLHDEDILWYVIEINNETLEFIKSDPEMEVGRREGNKIYITKVPYNPLRYLHETDNKLKRYYTCHCPLVREAILEEHWISPEVCNCSLGHASHYLAGLGLELKGEVLESAIKGDTRCRFVFYLPEQEGKKGE